MAPGEGPWEWPLGMAQPGFWVNQAAECQGHVRSRLCSLLPGISDAIMEPESHLHRAAGQGRAGQGGAERRELLMGRKSFGWPHARALGVTGPVPKAQAAASLVSLSLIPHSAYSPDNLPGTPVTLPAPHSHPIRWLLLCLFCG